MTPEEQRRIDAVEHHLAALMEHFDCVQLLCSCVNPKRETENVFLGAGNWFGRQGMAHDFLRQDQARTDAHEISKVMPKEPPYDTENWKNA